MPVVTWWGHSTTTLVDSGTRVLTDPLLTGRLAHLRRRRGPLPRPDALAADVAFVSHLHADHLHLPSLARLRPGTLVLLPKGAVRHTRGLRRLRGPELMEVTPGDRIPVGPVTVEVVPALHDGRRWPLGPDEVPALGFVLCGAARTYFAGDTDLFDRMAEVAGDCDLALLPVGGWGPSLGPGHLTPRRAARAVRSLSARAAVPIHFGTLWPIGMDAARPHLFDAPGREFVRFAGQLAPWSDVRELVPGQSGTFAAREARPDLSGDAPHEALPDAQDLSETYGGGQDGWYDQ